MMAQIEEKMKKKYFLFGLLNIKNSVKDELNRRFKISTACRRTIQSPTFK